MILTVDSIERILFHQLKSYWPQIDEELIKQNIPVALEKTEKTYHGMPNSRLWNGHDVVFSPYMSTQWMNFLYRLSHELYLNGAGIAADQVYYLNKIMHSNDWFYAIELPVHFHCEHPLGSVLGRAVYGDYLFIYQGTTVGGNRSHGELRYPTLGDNVVLYANATVLGNCRIGNNVLVSSGSYLLNEDIPDNSIVFGISPNIVVKSKTENVIKEYTKHIWGW